MEQGTPGRARTTSPGEAGAAPTTAMVAVPTGPVAQQVPGLGVGGAAALSLPTISLRNASTMQYVKWNVAFDNVVALNNLTQVVADGEPPKRGEVKALYPDLSREKIDERYDEALRQYQHENREYDMVDAVLYRLRRRSLSTASVSR